MLRSLIRFCVARRLPVLVATAALAAYGVWAYLNTPIEAYPDVTNLQVGVIARLAGLAPEEIERQVTVPLERALNGTPDMITLRSESMFGLSLVTLVFRDGADPFRARAAVNERISQASLPPGTDLGLAPDATPLGDVYMFRVVSDRHTLAETRSELEWTIARLLKQVPGVADVVGMGGYLREIHVQVEPARLLAHDLTLSDVTDALERSNRNVGGGFLTHGEQALTVRGIGYLTGAEDIQAIVLANKDGTPVRIGDVARVVASHTPRLGAMGYDRDPEVAVGTVLLRRGENPALVLDAIRAKVLELNERVLHRGMRIEPFYDRSVLVGRTLGTVHHNLLFGAILVVSVVWLFLRSLRASLIVASVIPLALLGAFIGLHEIGLPANLISMGAIDFGILVDGAVVLVESVLHEAAARPPGSRDGLLRVIARAALSVARPTFFSMAIIIAALIPVFTLERVEGRIFRPLAMTYSFALVAALVLALTAIPALCAIVLRPRDAHVHEPELLVRGRAVYERLLRALLARRAAAIAGLLVLAAATAALATRTGTEFLPQLDEGDLVVYSEMPPSISLEKGEDILLEQRRRLLAFPEVESVLSKQGRPEDGTDNEGVNLGQTFVHLLPREHWREGWSKDRLIEAMRASLSEVPGVSLNFSQPIRDRIEETVAGVRGQVVLKIFGPDLDRMKDTLEHAIASLRTVRGVVDLGLYRESTVPELQIVLDRAALARAGITVGAAQDVVETALGGRVVTELWHNERSIPVRVILPLAERDDETRIGSILVPAVGGARVPLREIARIERTGGWGYILREENSRFMALKFHVEGRDMGSVIKDAMAAVARSVTVPPSHYLVWGGEFENQRRAMARLGVIVPLSALVVLVLLYAALGSLPSAAAVLAAAPFALTGGVLALIATRIPLSVSAAVGFIALLGQATLASLLVISAVDERRRRGEDAIDAVIHGAADRFRVVLMTAVLAILGLMPAALSAGVGSETQRPFAVVIIGGLFSAVAVTLLGLPVLYTLVVRRVPSAASASAFRWDDAGVIDS